MRNTLRIILILSVCAAFGYAIGYGFTSIMTKKTDKGYIGRSELKIEDGKMTAETLLSFGRLSDPQISPDGTKVLYGVSYTSIDENKSCRNLFLSNIDGSEALQLTHYAKSVSNARWSLDGKSIYFIQGGQIWKADLKGNKLGRRVQLSDVANGVSEFLLSPDQTKLIYSSTIPGPVKTPVDADPRLSKAEAYSTEALMYRHWDHWVTETPRSYVASLENGMITSDNSTDILGSEPYELPTEPFGGLEQLSWHPDGKLIAYSCRKVTGKEYAFSTNTEIYLYDSQSGATSVIAMGGGYDTDPSWSEDGKHLSWLSMERDGYEADRTRIMICDVDCSNTQKPVVSNIKELTKEFNHDAAGLVWDGDMIYFSALMDEAVQSIFRTDLEGNIERLTPGDWWFDFDSPWAIQDGKLLTSYCSLEFPTELVAVTLGENPSYEQITHENEHLLAQLDKISMESRHIKTVDGKDMQTWVLYPPHFDENKKYPSILITLGGPQGTNSQGWSYRWCYRLMAQQGYVVVMPNRRGTTAFGQEWKEQISGDYIGLNMQDYMSAARELKAEPFIDKMAAVGASYGGYSVYYLSGIHDGLFDCFIAHAGIFDEEAMWYTTEEMWFPNWDNGGLGEGPVFDGIRQGGAPYSDLPKAVRHYTNSPEKNIQKWDTPILCIHGEKDYRIPYEQGMAAFNAAQMMGVPSRLVVFPSENHWILQPQNSLYWHKEFYDWLSRWM